MRVIIVFLPFIFHIKSNYCLFPSTNMNLWPNSKLACKEVSGKQLGKESNEVKETLMMGWRNNLSCESFWFVSKQQSRYQL